MQQPLLLDETYALELFGYFLLAATLVGVLVVLLLGKFVFSTDKKTAGGKIGRVFYLLAAGFIALVIISVAW
jgi:hypothetical protein